MKKISNSSDTFGSYIRRLRIKNDIRQRELAKKIGVAPSYLNDMEKNKRTAPRTELIKKLSVILKADLDLLYLFIIFFFVSTVPLLKPFKKIKSR